MVSVSLVGNPNLADPKDAKRAELLEKAKAAAEVDAEFVLKVSVLKGHPFQ